jgi:hypothetical protein
MRFEHDYPPEERAGDAADPLDLTRQIDNGSRSPVAKSLSRNTSVTISATSATASFPPLIISNRAKIL